MKIKTILLTAFVAIIAVISGFSPSDNPYQPGDKVADFKLKNIDDKMVSLADYKDAKGFIIIFTCNHCPYSVLYEDRIIALHNKYAALGYPVIAINPNDAVKEPSDSFDKMKVRAQEKAFPFVYLHDETQQIARKFGAARTPHVFIVNKNKKDIILNYIGAIDNNAKEADKATEFYVQNAVDNLLADKKVETNITKAIGCTIKWKE